MAEEFASTEIKENLITSFINFFKSKKQIFITTSIVIFLIIIGVTFYAIQNRQTYKSRAAEGSCSSINQVKDCVASPLLCKWEKGASNTIYFCKDQCIKLKTPDECNKSLSTCYWYKNICIEKPGNASIKLCKTFNQDNCYKNKGCFWNGYSIGCQVLCEQFNTKEVCLSWANDKPGSSGSPNCVWAGNECNTAVHVGGGNTPTPQNPNKILPSPTIKISPTIKVLPKSKYTIN